MTRSDDSQNTRPISVAELLARNGTIGAPPAGGRRRRRRGATGTISVAELTGEIPIITDRDLARQPVAEEPVAEEPVEKPAEPEQPIAEEPAAEAEAEPEAEPEAEAQPETEPTDLSSPAAGNGVVEHANVEVEEPEAATEAEAEDVTEAEDATDVEEADTEAEDATEVEEADTEEADVVEEADVEEAEDEADDDYAGAVSDYTAHIKQREADVDLPFFVPPRRSSTARRLSVVPDAEEMSPDPEPVGDELALDWSDSADTKADEVVDADGDAEDFEDTKDTEDTKASRSFLRTGGDELFGGPTVDDDAAVRAVADTEVIAIDRKAESGGAMSSFMHGVWIVGQCVFAVAFGAGLFVAFDQLWKWNNIVALVLSVLVILGLVVGVRVVRKTEDIGSTLIAVAVGALVTLGPLALLQSG